MIFTHQPTTRHLRSLSIAVTAALTLAACGGSDDATPEPAGEPAGEEVAGGNDASDPLGNETDTGDAPIGIDENGEIDFSDEVDDIVASVGFDTMVGIIADQLDPVPEVTVDGNNAMLTFSEGSVASNAWLPCGVAGAILTEGQAVTVVYPDGEQLCE